MNQENIFEDYCVAFIDILGFKEMTNSIEKIQEFSRVINESLDLIKNYDPNDKIFPQMKNESKIISMQGADSIFFMFPKDFNNVYLITNRLCVLQLILTFRGIYIRGSINSGAMYIDEKNKIFFGEAWNKAVASEAGAVNPRIILENSLAKFIEERLRTLFNESVGEFYLDDDGTYILSSYGIFPDLQLRQCFGEAYGYGEKNWLWILFKELEQNIKKNSDKRTILQKYLWIVNQIKRHQYGEQKEHAEKIEMKIIDLLTKL